MPPSLRTESMDEASLARVLKAVIKEEKLATQADVEAIHDKLQNHEQRFEDLDRRFEELERTVLQGARPQRTSTGSRASTSEGFTSSQEGWVPHLGHIRGFARFGCGPSDKLRKQELLETQMRLLGLCDAELNMGRTPLGGFAINHNVSFMWTATSAPGTSATASTGSSSRRSSASGKRRYAPQLKRRRCDDEHARSSTSSRRSVAREKTTRSAHGDCKFSISRHGPRLGANLCARERIVPVGRKPPCALINHSGYSTFAHWCDKYRTFPAVVRALIFRES